MQLKILQTLFFTSSLLLVYGHKNESPFSKHEKLHQRRKREIPTNPFDPDFSRKLTESIQKSVNSQLARSFEFADAINAQVNEQLAPVHRMQLKSRMAQGTGGTTVITFGEKIRFVNDGVSYNCPSNQVTRQENSPPKCTEELVVDNLEDPCTFNGKGVSIVQNFYCFGNNVIMSCINNNCTCQGGRVYTIDQLQTLCGSNFGTRNYAKYEYYPDIFGVNAIDFNSDANKAMHLCDYSDLYACVWTDAGYPSV